MLDTVACEMMTKKLGGRLLIADGALQWFNEQAAKIFARSSLLAAFHSGCHRSLLARLHFLDSLTASIWRGSPLVSISDALKELPLVGLYEEIMSAEGACGLKIVLELLRKTDDDFWLSQGVLSSLFNEPLQLCNFRLVPVGKKVARLLDFPEFDFENVCLRLPRVVQGWALSIWSSDPEFPTGSVLVAPSVSDNDASLSLAIMGMLIECFPEGVQLLQGGDTSLVHGEMMLHVALAFEAVSERLGELYADLKPVLSQMQQGLCLHKAFKFAFEDVKNLRRLLEAHRRKYNRAEEEMARHEKMCCEFLWAGCLSGDTTPELVAVALEAFPSVPVSALDLLGADTYLQDQKGLLQFSAIRQCCSMQAS